MSYSRTDPKVRFWRRVDRRGPDDCWPWTGSCNHARGGHGCFHDEHGQSIAAHRYAFFLTHGYMSQLVRHRCDNPPCCNPAHLLEGTQKENIADMYARGRAPIGVKHGRVRLTEDDVREIRASREKRRVLAARFGIAPQTVWDIRRRKRWKHVA